MILKRPLLWIMLVAAILRATATLPFSLHHPDEVFQYLEQAHRLVFGYGVVPWEYRYGMRSWLLPILVAGPMRIGAWIAPSSFLYAKLPQLLAAIANLSIVWSAWDIGKRSHPTHGIVAAAVMAIWFEQIFFASHLLTEVLATACFLPAAAFLTAPAPSQRKLIAAGLLFGLTAVLRFHYIPAIAVMVLLGCKFEFKRLWLPISVGGGLVILFASTIDLIFNQKPFGWVIENFHQNAILNKSSQYGISGPEAYFAFISEYWQFASLPMLLLILPTVRNNQIFLWSAFLNIAIHTAIGHKEYRFIFLSTTILIILSAIGSAELVRRLLPYVRNNYIKRASTSILILSWTSISLMLSSTDSMRRNWNAFGPSLELARRAGANPQICGIALHNRAFWEAGGYSYLHREIPLYLTAWSFHDRMSSNDFVVKSPAYNAIITSSAYASDIPPGYKPLACAGRGYDLTDPTHEQCLYYRVGKCDPAKARDWELGRVLLRHDQ